MNNLRTIRSFTVELLKSAADIKDSDIRKLISDRRGEDYLEGGRLPTNSFDEAPPLIKAADSNKEPPANFYQKSRDYAISGAKGALTGIAILGATNAMRGHFNSPAPGIDTIRTAKRFRRAAAIGGGAGLLDRAIRKDFNKEASFVVPGLNKSFRSPKEELAKGMETGKFESHVIHDYGRPPRTFQLGKKFRIP